MSLDKESGCLTPRSWPASDRMTLGHQVSSLSFSFLT